MNTHTERTRSLPPLPPMRNRWLRRIKLGPLLVLALFAVFLCYPASLVMRGFVSSAYMKQGEDALMGGRWNEARQNYNAAMDWSLENETPFDQRWNVALQSGDIEAAVTDFSAVIAAHPDRPMGYCYRADAYRELDRNDEALRDYRACLAHNPGHIWQQVAQNAIRTLTRPAK